MKLHWKGMVPGDAVSSSTEREKSRYPVVMATCALPHLLTSFAEVVIVAVLVLQWMEMKSPVLNIVMSVMNGFAAVIEGSLKAELGMRFGIKTAPPDAAASAVSC